MQVGPRTYLGLSTAYNALAQYSPQRITAGHVIASRAAGRQTLYHVREVRVGGEVGAFLLETQANTPQEDVAHVALAAMLQHNVSALAVVDASRTWVAGILTQNDFLRRVALPEADAQAVACGDIMTPMADTAYVLPDNDVESCMAVMAELGVHHLPVLDAPPGGAPQPPPPSCSAGSGIAWGSGPQAPHTGAVLAAPLLGADTAPHAASAALQGLVSLEELLGLNRAARAASAAKLAELSSRPTSAVAGLLDSLGLWRARQAPGTGGAS